MLTTNYINDFPEKPGVYLWKNKNKVLYVWKAKNLKKRLLQYFRTNIWVWKEDMVSKADNIDYFLSKNEEEALILEEKLVKKYNPPYNSLLKWDNAYVYIHIGEWHFPKISFTHFKKWKGIFIWPKPYKKDLKNMLLTLRRLLKFRTCSDTKFKKGKLCSDYTLWLCAGWCVTGWQDNRMKAGLQDWNIMAEWKQDNHSEYKKIIKIIKDFFNWKTKELEKLILEKINQAVEEENFEYAQILKNIYLNIEKLSQKQTIELWEKVNWYFIKIRKENSFYFMIYMKFVNWKLVDIVKLKNDENNFLSEMIRDNIIKTYKKIWENFYFWE